MSIPTSNHLVARHSANAPAGRVAPRRLAATVIVAFATIAPVALVDTVSAAPAPVASTPSAERKVEDPLAAQAVAAAGLLARYTSGDGSVWDGYVAGRDAIAAEAAARIGIEPTRMVDAWATTSIEHQRAILAAFTQLGVAYRRNSSRPGIGFDCSGLTTYAWGQAGVTLPRSSGSQIRRVGRRTADTARAGDLVQYPGHVMIWLGVDNAIIHSPQSGRVVSVDTVSTRRSLRYGDPLG